MFCVRVCFGRYNTEHSGSRGNAYLFDQQRSDYIGLGFPCEPDWTSDDRNVDLEWTAEYFSRYQGNLINQNEE